MRRQIIKSPSPSRRSRTAPLSTTHRVEDKDAIANCGRPSAIYHDDDDYLEQEKEGNQRRRPIHRCDCRRHHRATFPISSFLVVLVALFLCFASLFLVYSVVSDQQQSSSSLFLRNSPSGCQNCYYSFDDLQQIRQKWTKRAKKLVQEIRPAKKPIDLFKKSQHPRKYAHRRPFVFFHQRKAGGTSMRTFLLESAEDLHVPAWIPCEDPPRPQGCRLYNIPLPPPNSANPKENMYAIYGGHMYYADVANQFEYHLHHEKRRQQQQQQDENDDDDDDDDEISYYTFETDKTEEPPDFDCLTNFRSPVSRVVSSWNFRQIRHGAPPASSLSAEEWDRLLPLAYSEFGEGNNNEAARIFGDIANERVVNTLTSTTCSGSMVAASRWYLVSRELDIILSRYSNCVIVLQERCEDSKIVLKYYYPWLGNIVDCNFVLLKSRDEWKQGRRQTKNNSDGAEDDDGLQPGAKQVILKHNQVDVQAYEFAKVLFEEQLATAKAALAKQ